MFFLGLIISIILATLVNPTIKEAIKYKFSNIFITPHPKNK